MLTKKDIHIYGCKLEKKWEAKRREKKRNLKNGWSVEAKQNTAKLKLAIIFEDLLKCPICNQTFKGSPIVLSCCESTVCQHHVEENDDATPRMTTRRSKRKLFTCVLCEKAHDTENVKKFATNKTIEKLLTKDVLEDIQMVLEINKGETFDKTSSQTLLTSQTRQELQTATNLQLPRCNCHIVDEEINHQIGKQDEIKFQKLKVYGVRIKKP